MAGSKSTFVYVKMDRSDKLSRMLQARPNLVYQFDSQGRSLLHWAVIKNSIGCLNLLLKHRVNLD